MTIGQESSNETPPVAEASPRSRVLVVEDDPAFSDFLVWSLTDHGYAVETAGSTHEALSRLGVPDDAAPFDLVLSDVAMPGGSGTDLLFSPAIVDRNTPVILMSGFGTNELQAFVTDAGAEFLQKPFKLDALFQCVLGRLRTRFDTPPPTRLSLAGPTLTSSSEDTWSEGQPIWPRATPEKRVLVAEDDTAMRELLVLVLRERGYEVDTVSSGSEMIRVLFESSPDGSLARQFDLIVTDVRMPGASGFDAIDQLRRRGNMTPVIAVTAFPHDATRQRAQQLAIRLLAKPFDLAALRQVVDAALESLEDAHDTLGR